jgi:membrane protease YdiL (CAAX protease family)
VNPQPGSGPAPPGRPPAPLAAYAIATVITVVAILSQYFVPQLLPATRPAYSSLLSVFAIVYGIPIVAFAALVGIDPLRNWRTQMGRSLVEGFSWYGVLTLLGLFLAIVVLGILIALNPSAGQALSKPTPVVQTAMADPWFWVALSFPVGILEETIFRGWIFGYWLTRDPANWKFHAAWTSLLFAGMHVYYALTYGIVFLIPAILLVCDGLAFAIAMRESGGNLVTISFLHGWNDATAFMALAILDLGVALHYAVVLLGALVALVAYLRQQALRNPPLRPLDSSVPLGASGER